MEYGASFLKSQGFSIYFDIGSHNIREYPDFRNSKKDLSHWDNQAFYWSSCRRLRRISVGHFGRRGRIVGRSEYDYSSPRPAWNAGRKVGAKRPLKPRQIWAIRFHLDREHRLRDLALFDLAIDSKLRGCDLVKMKIGDLVAGGKCAPGRS